MCRSWSSCCGCRRCSPLHFPLPHSETKRALGIGLHRRFACFETRPSGAPQHEVFTLITLNTFLILRRPRSGRLEGRTTPTHPVGGFRNGPAVRERDSIRQLRGKFNSTMTLLLSGKNSWSIGGLAMWFSRYLMPLRSSLALIPSKRRRERRNGRTARCRATVRHRSRSRAAPGGPPAHRRNRANSPERRDPGETPPPARAHRDRNRASLRDRRSSP